LVILHLVSTPSALTFPGVRPSPYCPPTPSLTGDSPASSDAAKMLW